MATSQGTPQTAAKCEKVEELEETRRAGQRDGSPDDTLTSDLWSAELAEGTCLLCHVTLFCHIERPFCPLSFLCVFVKGDPLQYVAILDLAALHSVPFIKCPS